MATRDDTKTGYPTQLSIAQAAGVSRTTVAEVLSGKREERYNDETRQKVFAAAKRLNYRPHRSAQEVRRGRSNLIGVFHTSGMIQTATDRALALGRAIMRSGFELFLNDGLWYDGNIEHSIERMLSARVEGVLISSPLQLKEEGINTLKEALRAANIPIVITNGSAIEGAPMIEADLAQGFADLSEHLIATGRRRLIIIVDPNDRKGTQRLEGFRRTILKHGGTLHADLSLKTFKNPWQGNGLEGVLINPDTDFRELQRNPCAPGEALFEALLDKGLEAEAVLASNDYQATGILTACHRRQIRVPEELAITGADNAYIATQGTTPLTTIEQPIEEICNLAVETLLRHIAGTATEQHQGAVLPCRLLVRHSTCARNFSR